ncbi:MAG: A24 family peptidase C-terminal domain-containing protein, partial [Candidatus Bathyarchaeia archaeon]
ETILDMTRLVVGTVILSYASYTDIKTRRASNILWIIMGSIGGVLLAVQYFTTYFKNQNIYYLIFIPIMISLVYLLFQMRLIFGGADAKALMAIALLAPFQPIIENLPFYGVSVMPFPWTIFSNSIIIFLLGPLSLLFFNIVKRNIKFPYAFLGYKMSVEKAKEKFVWPLEKLVDGKRKFMYMPKDFDVDEELEEFENHGIKEIWVTPKIPFMIPLLAGFICSFIFGDILFYLINSIIR